MAVKRILGIFFLVALAFGQGSLIVDVSMIPDYYHESYCCMDTEDEPIATYEIEIDFRFVATSGALDNCTLRVAIDPGDIADISFSGLGVDAISDIPGFDSERSTSNVYFIGLGAMAAGSSGRLSFTETFRDLGPCEDFTTRAEIFSEDSSYYDSDVANVDFFIIPEVTAEIVQYPDTLCHRLITDVIVEYCPHGRDIGGMPADSIVVNLNFDEFFWRTDSVYWPQFNLDATWDTTYQGTVQYVFLGRTDTCARMTDTLRLFSTRMPNSPWCEGQHFVVNIQDYIDCNATGAHDYAQDIFYTDRWLNMPLDIGHHLRIDRLGPMPQDSITGDSRTVCYEPDRQCICIGDTIRISSTVEVGEMMCRPYGVNLLLLAWPRPGTSFRDIETEALYSGESGYFLAGEYPLDSLTSGDIVTFSRDIVIEDIPAGNNIALTFGDSIFAVGPCTGLGSNRMTFLPCSLTALSIVKTADRSTYTTGDTALFRIEVTNDGARPFDNVWVSDSLGSPSWGRFISAYPPPDNISDTRIEWRFESFESEYTEILTAEMEIFASDSFPECDRTFSQTNFASGEAFSGSGDRDMQYADTSLTIDIEVPCLCLFDLDRNSFSPEGGEEVRIRILTRKREEVIFDVYNIAGRRIRSLEPVITRGGANWEYTTWDGMDDDGNSVPSGTYYIVLRGEYNFETGGDYRCGYKAINIYNK